MLLETPVSQPRFGYPSQVILHNFSSVLSFVLVANVEMAGANYSSAECSVAVRFQGKTTVSPDGLKTVVDTLFERLPLRPTVRHRLKELLSVRTRVENYDSAVGFFPVR